MKKNLVFLIGGIAGFILASAAVSPSMAFAQAPVPGPQAPAVNLQTGANVAGIQAGASSRSKTAVFISAYNTWSAWSGDSAYMDYIRPFLNPTFAATNLSVDVRVCIQIGKYVSVGGGRGGGSIVLQEGAARCTPWASDIDDGVGEAIDWAAHYEDPNTVRIRVETRALPTKNYRAIRVTSLGMAAAEGCSARPADPLYFIEPGDYNGGANTSGQSWITPTYRGWMARFVTDGNSVNPDCYKIAIRKTSSESPVLPTGTPEVGLRVAQQNIAAGGARFVRGVNNSGVWSDWVQTPSATDIDQGQVYVRYQPNDQNRSDMRFCLQVANAMTEAESNAQCTRWISETGTYNGGTQAIDNSPWALPASGSNPNYMRVKVEMRAMPAGREFNYVQALYLGIRAADPYNQTCSGAGTMAWAGANAVPWSSWVTDGGGSYFYNGKSYNTPDPGKTPDCWRLHYDARIAAASPSLPVITFTASPSTVVQNQPATLSWSATNNVAQCRFTTWPWEPGGVSGTTTVYPNPPSTTYGLACISSTVGKWRATSEVVPTYGGPCNQVTTCPNSVPASAGAQCSTIGTECAVRKQYPNSDGFCFVDYYSCQGSESTASVTVSATPLPPEPKANLIGTPNSANAVAGIGTQLSGSVYNGGDREARSTSQSGNFNNTFRVYDYQTGQTSTWSVATGPLERLASRTVYADYTFPAAGSYSFSFCADQNTSGQGSVTESNESDNCDSTSEPVELTVGEPAPAYLYLQASPFIIKRDATTVFDWTAQNVQPGSCYVNPTNISTYGVYGLNDNGETSGLRESNSIPARGNWVLYCTDLLGNGVESNSVEVRLLPGFSEF